LILSTNIAESSVTVAEVRYVLDFCLTKETNYNIESGVEKLELSWCSKASLTQRRGRTGRTCDGVCFRLVHRALWSQMEDFQRPEILRTPLEKIILKIKRLNQMEAYSP
jgi:HrpA-like RNA helicase